MFLSLQHMLLLYFTDHTGFVYSVAFETIPCNVYSSFIFQLLCILVVSSLFTFLIIPALWFLTDFSIMIVQLSYNIAFLLECHIIVSVLQTTFFYEV